MPVLRRVTATGYGDSKIDAAALSPPPEGGPSDDVTRLRTAIRSRRNCIWHGLVVASGVLFFLGLMHVHRNTEGVEGHGISLVEVAALLFEVPSFLLAEFFGAASNSTRLKEKKRQGGVLPEFKDAGSIFFLAHRKRGLIYSGK